MSVALFYLNVLPLLTFSEDKQFTAPLMNARTSPSVLKVGTSSPVKATASFLMWSVISSELALLQHEGLRSVGKTSVKEKRGNVYLSLLVGHDFHFDLSADQLMTLCLLLACRRTHKVTMSATKGPGWSLDNTCQDESTPNGMPAGAVKISFCVALLHCKWLTGNPKNIPTHVVTTILNSNQRPNQS